MRLLRRVAKQRDIRILVETGTYRGDTLAALKKHFTSLHSIELSDELFQRARELFKNDRNVSVWHGDSGEVLSDVLGTLREPALFWLDGHYSGSETALGRAQTPILDELKHIAAHANGPSHIAIVDDARLFNGANGYPALSELSVYCRALGLNEFCVENDMIVISYGSR